MIVGIDPGLTGSIAFVNREQVCVRLFDMPVIRRVGKGHTSGTVDAEELANILDHRLLYDDGDPPVVYLERVASMPGQGVSSVFSMGDTFGCIRGICGALGLNLQLVTPQVWKKDLDLGREKLDSLVLARKQFNEVADQLTRAKDHNRAEALLIALYGLKRTIDG